ncbi:MAG TPA: agmatinase [Thermoanaerobaculia bacterium]|jgi:agmatinase|nr:agmatinase [Thermoanaerobaculia bacterium]
MPSQPTNFGLLEGAYCDYDRSRAVVLPVPFERTTTYGKGTAHGPAAIIRASQAMELYDEELESEPYDQGIATLPPFLPEAFDMAAALAEIEAEAQRHFALGKFLVVLGGEHSLSLAPARAARSVHGGIAVVQFDAHADLREEFEGTPYSHASVMKRIVDDGFPTLAIGLRSLSVAEAHLVRRQQLPVLWGYQLDQAAEAFAPLLAALPQKVYLSFDIDYFDPALVPATGTPEPGGGWWYPTLALLRALFSTKTVVGMDLVELAPIGGQPASDFLAAKLIYKCLGYLQESESGIVLH